MYKINNLLENDNILIKNQKGPYTIVEYKRDLSLRPENVINSYYCSKMGINKRQLICDLSRCTGIKAQAGAMQWTIGKVEATTGIKGVGDLLSKAIKSQVTSESAIKPEYRGNGILVLEPTYKHLFLLNLEEWGGAVVLDDGVFWSCESSINISATMRSNVSSAFAGGEGLFSLCLKGSGFACLESDCPIEEMVEVELNEDILRIDGNLALAWSKSLQFTVEKSGKSLIGSATSGEGLVNVYRGTGKVLLCPVK